MIMIIKVIALTFLSKKKHFALNISTFKNRNLMIRLKEIKIHSMLIHCNAIIFVSNII